MKHATATLVLLLGFTAACKKDAPAPVTPTFIEDAEMGGSNEKDENDDHDKHEHTEGVHLGAHMYELSRRFAAVWYAGQAGNIAMLDYQLHEMEEVIEELDETRPEEAGVDVVARLKSDVESQFENLEASVEKGDTEAFEATYQTIMAKCTTCHVDTKHAFIQVKTPDYNPYSNVSF